MNKLTDNNHAGFEKKSIEISLGDVSLQGDLLIPDHALSLVIFSHGSGSSRFSPRNNFVAQQLERKGIATLLTDLLTPKEDAVYATRFNIELLTDRLVAVTKWLLNDPELSKLRFGYFGASTGAASALRAAIQFPHHIHAIVSRGGRPDLAMNYLYAVEAPTLFIVGELDTDVIRLNREAYNKLVCTKQFSIVPDATHLFEEPGALEEVSSLSAKWFTTYLSKKAARTQSVNLHTV